MQQPQQEESPLLALLDDLARLAAELQAEGLLDDWKPGQDAPGCRSSDSRP